MSDEIKVNEPTKLSPPAPEDVSRMTDNYLFLGAGPGVINEEIDDLMCRVLESLGYEEGVEIFRKMHKSYG
jgi:hypothetical protein